MLHFNLNLFAFHTSALNAVSSIASSLSEYVLNGEGEGVSAAQEACVCYRSEKM